MDRITHHRDGLRLRKRYGKLRSHLFTFLDHPEVPADNNGSERELRPTATYRKVTGGFRSKWGADLFAGVRSVIGTAARRGLGAYQAIQQTVRRQGKPVLPHSRCSCAAPAGGNDHMEGMPSHSECTLSLVQIAVVFASGRPRRRPGRCCS